MMRLGGAVYCGSVQCGVQCTTGGLAAGAAKRQCLNGGVRRCSGHLGQCAVHYSVLQCGAGHYSSVAAVQRGPWWLGGSTAERRCLSGGGNERLKHSG